MVRTKSADAIRSKVVAVRLFPEAWSALDAAAKADGRTLSQYVERLITAHLATIEPTKPTPTRRRPASPQR